MVKLSIVIPVYNEKNYIVQILKKVDNLAIAGVAKEIIIVDDGSTDGTAEILKVLGSSRYQIIFHPINQGKGAALKTGFAKASGDVIAIQDADLEYNPKDLVPLVGRVLSGQNLVVYGSRMIGRNPIGHVAYYWGSKLISVVTNLLYQTKLTDVETGYKVFAAPLLKSIKLEQDGFAFEVEVTAKILKRGIKIIELPITYAPRQFSEGKKINWADGVEALWLLIKYRFSSR